MNWYPPHSGRFPYRSVLWAEASLLRKTVSVRAGVAEVKSFQELQALGDKAKGKIIFFNRPMDPTRIDTFQAYAEAAEQRVLAYVHPRELELGAIATAILGFLLAQEGI